jgi:hypothetical protein
LQKKKQAALICVSASNYGVEPHQNHGAKAGQFENARQAMQMEGNRGLCFDRVFGAGFFLMDCQRRCTRS